MENNTKKSIRTSVDLIPTLNRAIVMSAFISEKPLVFSIKHDKKSTALQFQVDPNQPLLKSHKVHVNMYRNLESNCKFSQLFFNIENIQNKKCDYRGKFLSVKPSMNRVLIPFLKDKYEFQFNDDKISQNYMIIWGWKLQDSDNDLLFYFIQRKCYNDIIGMNVVRTAGLQLYTERGKEIFDRYYENNINDIRKVEEGDDVPAFFEDDDDDDDK